MKKEYIVVLGESFYLVNKEGSFAWRDCGEAARFDSYEEAQSVARQFNGKVEGI
jgi:hypothetical protein